MKFTAIVSSFRAQIIDFVNASVLQFEKPKHLVDVIAINTFQLGGRKSHCDHFGQNIWIEREIDIFYLCMNTIKHNDILTCQVQIKSILGIALLLLADKPLNWNFHARHYICHTILPDAGGVDEIVVLRPHTDVRMCANTTCGFLLYSRDTKTHTHTQPAICIRSFLSIHNTHWLYVTVVGLISH